MAFPAREGLGGDGVLLGSLYGMLENPIPHPASLLPGEETLLGANTASAGPRLPSPASLPSSPALAMHPLTHSRGQTSDRQTHSTLHHVRRAPAGDGRPAADHACGDHRARLLFPPRAHLGSRDGARSAAGRLSERGEAREARRAL